MKVQLLVGFAAAASVALADASEMRTEDLPRHRLQRNSNSRIHDTSGKPRDLRAVAPESRNGRDGSMQMAKSSKTTANGNSKSSKSVSPDKESSKSGKADSGSGKESKSGKSSKESYYIGPISCPGHCIDVSGVNLMTGELSNVLKSCDNDSSEQTWHIHNDGTFVKLESAMYPGECIGIKYKDACIGTEVLVLGDCDDHESMWYFTGGQLVSAYCWVNGYTNAMFVDLNGNGSCRTELFGYEGTGEPVLRQDLFMFIDRDMIEGKDALSPTTSMPTTEPTLLPSYVPTTSTAV